MSLFHISCNRLLRMHRIHWIHFVFSLCFSVHGTTGKVASSCDETISLVYCHPLQIIILNITAPKDLASEILENCNGKKECQVRNPSRDCVRLEYGCRRSMGQTVTINDSPRLQLELDGHTSMLNLKSADYLKGQYMKARNIECSLQPEEKGNRTLRKIQIFFYDFATFAISTDFCFRVNSEQDPLICSGSGNLNRSSQIFYSTDGWQFSMELKGLTMIVPTVRFWISLDISSDDYSMYHLQCSSNSAISVLTMITVCLGTFLFIAVLACVVRAAWKCRKPMDNQASRNENADPPVVYADIDHTFNRTPSKHHGIQSIGGEIGPPRIQHQELPLPTRAVHSKIEGRAIGNDARSIGARNYIGLSKETGRAHRRTSLELLYTLLTGRRNRWGGQRRQQIDPFLGE